MREPSPFDHSDAGPRDRNARNILIGMAVVGLVLLVLVLPPISLLSGNKDNNNPSTGAQTSGTTGSNATAGSVKLPKAPDGFEAVSRLFGKDALVKPKDSTGPYILHVNLAAPTTDGRNLALYTNKDGKWERLATATLENNGSSATGQVADMPSNLAVLRRTTNAVQVTGWLPPGAQADTAALDVLTTVNPADFFPNADGTIAGSNTQFPATKGTVLPTVRALAQREADAVNAIIASPALRDAHINALVQLALQPGNSGVDIDYRVVTPARKADFSTFIATLSDRLHQSNKTLSITLPTPTKQGVSWDTGAYDWDELGRRADTIKLMAASDPSTYYKSMDDVFGFLKPKVDFKKVLLVVSRQSYEKGSDGLRSMSLKEGLGLASAVEPRNTAQITPGASVVVVAKNLFTDDGATGLRWDEGAFAVSFTYPGRGGPRTVWLENNLSVAFRLDLARRYGLGGVALEDVSLNPDAPAVWDVVRAYGETGNVSLVQPNSTLLRPTWQVQAGTTDPSPKGSVVWKAPPQPGSYDVSLIVSDGVVRATQKVVLQVGAVAPSGSPTATPRPAGSATPTR